ncbi:hypothetical protein GCM10007989_01440 [Devosia pacifica]|uniref:Activator of Hsp90 ATPase homologue 1/2-like C-terminal domain-containing protein n=1 Tax=Devosia pacifica TaxID=1335967 RepID=A0A918RUV2_9HYPH|nr:SRPBCC domain-containing protein [Devosia pacifica]GHA10875.1 hypothetical protein GCM10007989_01440 [Devosia pacifica]
MTLDPTESESEITLTRTIDAPVEDIFAAWTDPAILEQWQADEVEVEPFTGGHYRYTIEGDEETPGEHVIKGEYLIFEENQRLSMSWIYTAPGDENETIFVLDITFRGVDDARTEIKLVERGASHADPESRIFSMEAWDSALAHLADLIE